MHDSPGGNAHQRRKAERASGTGTNREVENSRPFVVDMPPEHKNRGREYLLAAIALAVEFLAVALGEAWLGWGAALLFWFAVYEYTKPVSRSLIRWGVRVAAALVLAVAMRYAVVAMEKHIRARMITAPKMQISLTRGKTLVLDNHKGDAALLDFQINAREYRLNAQGIANDHAQIDDGETIGGDLDFEHFDVKAGEIKRVDLTEGRYGYVLRMRRADDGLHSFDSLIYYLCLRVTFTNENSGERFVHYVVLSPYAHGFDLAEHPEAAGGASPSPPGTEGYPFSIARVIKADARFYYGTELREYQP
jgi:hypothetical protein